MAAPNETRRPRSSSALTDRKAIAFGPTLEESPEELKEKITTLLRRGNPAPWLAGAANPAQPTSVGWPNTSASALQVKPMMPSNGMCGRGLDVSCVGGTSFTSVEPAASGTPRSTGRWEWSTSTRRACHEGPCMLSREAVREPDAGDPQVRFDERRRERELRPSLRHRHQGESRRQQLIPQPKATAPAADSTLGEEENEDFSTDVAPSSGTQFGGT
jgi:hypothetical protein